MKGTGYAQKEKPMCNYICFWKTQSDLTRCLAKLHAAEVTRGLVATTVIGTIKEFLYSKSLSQLKSYTRFEKSLLYPYIHVIPPTLGNTLLFPTYSRKYIKNE